MEHKAFAFDWNAFQGDLAPVLREALSSDAEAELAAFIERHRQSLTDPYEGEPLPEDWSSLMDNRDVQEHGDFALTHYYSPTDDFGIGGSWLALADSFPAAHALLGTPFGPEHRLFDPGRMGSYFQAPDTVNKSLRELSNADRPELSDFVNLLENCRTGGMGVYVTF